MNQLQFTCKTVEISGIKTTCGKESGIESVLQLPTGNLCYRFGCQLGAELL